MDTAVVKVIQDFIKNKKREKGIVNEIVRDDVFSVIQEECTVLYYWLDDEIDGCHIIKPVNGEMRQFVFINTNKVIQEQVWTAAHELGHVWRVDSYVKEQVPDVKESVEEIVGRFAAEFLMPQKIFEEQLIEKLREYNFSGTSMSGEMMVNLVAYLMNFFSVPYKSIILRFIELGYVNSEDEQQYLEGFRKNNELYLRIIKENQFTRLEKREEVYSISNLKQDLEEMEEKEIASEKYIKRVRELFHIQTRTVIEDKLDFKG